MPTAQMLPRPIHSRTRLVQGGHCAATILYPAGDPAYAALAARLAQGIERCSGCRPALLPDEAALPTRSTPLPRPYRERPLILLGNLNTNRALLPLYARYYCATDALYPGGDGYDLRTIVNPYGSGENILLAGGSSLRGVERAVERLLARVEAAGRSGELEVPFLLEVEPAPELARRLAEWPETPLGVPLPTVASGQKRALGFNEALLRGVGAYASLYAWTGDERYALYSRDCLRTLNGLMGDSYGDWHYRAERILRALPWLAAGGFLSEADLLRTDRLLLGTALGTADMWWRLRSARPPLGHRHHGKGTYEFLLLARYLREQCAPNEAARALCDRWLEECHAFLGALAAAGIDDQDDESTLNNLATLYWYSLGEERYEFFTSGMARRVAQRAVALHDNMGAGAGQGGYGEGLAGSMYLQQEATTPVAAAALFYQDGELKWLLEHLPHLAIPIRLSFLGFAPIFMHKFDTGPELAACPPAGLSGLRALPLLPYQVEINDHPPEHIEYAGHTVNAPETWLRAEGIARNSLPGERGFDKVLVRSGFGPEAAYLLLQGYQGGYRWQGHMPAANCIVRFVQGGHIFLIQNTNRHSHYQKNGLFVSDGYNTAPLPPLAELLAAGDLGGVGLSATRLNDCHGGDWTRHLFWHKAGDGCFVVIDAVERRAPGPYSLTSTWRTPGYAAWDGHTWQARQGRHCFTLRSADRLPSTNEAEEDQGGANPYVLRQVRAGEGQAGELLTFQHLFYVRPEDAPENLDIQRLTNEQALIRRDGQAFAWCAGGRAGQALSALGLSLRALSAWASSQEIALAAATELALAGAPGWRLCSDAPIGLSLDLAAGRLAARIDGPVPARATLTIRIGGERTHTLEAGQTLTLPLPADGCRALSAALSAALAALPRPGELAAPVEPAGDWPPLWAQEVGAPLPERIRNLTVQADPPPLDGYADQLIDTVLPEVREAWQQWPAAPEYRIALRFPEPLALEHLRLVGDSHLDPTLRTFCPLPEALEAAVSSDGFQRDERPCAVEPQPGLLRFKRFRDVQDQMETRTVPVGQMAQQVRLRIPAPAGGRPLVLHEIEVYGRRRLPARVRHLAVADLTGQGQPAAVVIDAAAQLSAWDGEGRRLWQRALPGTATHLSCHDLDGRGRRSLCIGMAGGEVLIVSPEGELQRTIPLGEVFLSVDDAYFGWLNSINSLAVWHREPDGRAALAAGGYGLVFFLDPEGRLLGHSWGDGPWMYDLLPAAPDARGARDLWARTGWNHGICFYEGYPGLAPSGEGVVFGGVRQPLFRPLRRLIPFVNGRTVAFDWLDGEGRAGASLLAAAENGVGILSSAGRDWLWKIEGGAPIGACAAGTVEGQGAILVGGADGFLAAFSQEEGRPLRRLHTGAPVLGLAVQPEGGLVVANRDGVLALDSDWRIIKRHIAPIERLHALGQGRLIVALRDGRLEMLSST